MRMNNSDSREKNNADTTAPLLQPLTYEDFFQSSSCCSHTQRHIQFDLERRQDDDGGAAGLTYLEDNSGV
jgi:hypothetical protein